MYTESLRNIRKGKVRKWLKVSQGGFVFSQNTRSVYPYVWQLSKPSSLLLRGSSAVHEMVMSLGSYAGCGCIVVCLDIKFSLVVSSQSTVSLCGEMSLSRPLHEDLKDLNQEAVGESGRPRLENKTCVGTVADLPQGLNPTGEPWGVLGPGLWRFVACIADFPLPQHGACHGWHRCDVWALGTVHVLFCDSSSFRALPRREIQNHDQPFGATPRRECCLVGRWRVVPWPEGCSPGPKWHWGAASGQAGWEQVGHKTPLSLAMLLQIWENALSNVQGSLARSAAWVLTGLQQLPGLLQNSRWSIRPGLLSRGCWPVSRPMRWMGAPFQTGRTPLTGFAVLECRFPLPYLVLEKKKRVCFVYPWKCQKPKILKTLSKTLISFKKRAIEIVILLSYCLTNLLSPVFSAQKWGLTRLKQGEFFPFIYCSVSSYQSRS